MSSTTAQADVNGDLQRGVLTTGHAAFLDWYRGNDQWSLYAGLQDISNDFRADNGFFSQTGFRSASVQVSKKLGKIGIFNEFNVNFFTEYKLDADGNTLSKTLAPGIFVAGAYDSHAYLDFFPAGQSRVNQNGELFSTAKLAGGMGISPGQTVARLGLHFNLGEVIDIESNRVERGGSVNLSAKLRPMDRLEFEPSIAVNWINSQGQRAYTETAMQVNDIVHLSAKDTVRMILQAGHTARKPDLYSTSVAPDSKRNVRSFVYAHSAGLGRAIFFGLTQSDSDTPGFVARRKQSELFAKFSWQI